MKSSARWLLLANAVALSVLLFSFVALWIFYSDRIMPGVSVQHIAVSGLTKNEAAQLIAGSVKLPTALITVTTNEFSVASSSAELGAQLDIDAAVEKAFAQNRVSSPVSQVWNIFTGYFTTHSLTIPVKVDNYAVENMVRELKQMVPNQGEMARASLGYSGSVGSLEIFPGVMGSGVDVEATTRSAVASIHSLQPTLPSSPTPTEMQHIVVPADLSHTGQSLFPEEIAQAQTRAEAFVGKSIELTANELTLKLNDQQLVSLLAFPTGFNNDELKTTLSGWEKRVNRPAQEPLFTYSPETLEVTAFTPPKPGLSLNTTQALSQLTFTMEELEKQAVLPPVEGQTPTKVFTGTVEVTTAAPTNSLANSNNLGINERIGFGESEYAHSIPSRVHNVANASKIINNYIVKPGEEFSFNKALGEVSRRTGFQPAYVISGGRTVLGDGGGVCQVSTTVFRSALNAGLPITKRKAHSYRVSYYELDTKPGVDATVYSGEVDLRFMNDTGHHILISTNTDSENLYMTVELYGTSDGRTAEIVDHKTWDYRPPAATVYIPDPSLPPGKLKQVDWSASGIKASFKNVVKDKNGQVIREEEFYSNYVPWSAKYLRGI